MSGSHYNYIIKELNVLFDELSKIIARWLSRNLQNATGDKWWKVNVYNVLNTYRQQHIDDGDWKTIDDLDLYALLIVFERNFKCLSAQLHFGKNDLNIIINAREARNRCIGHRPAKGLQLRDIKLDLLSVDRFCRLITVGADYREKLEELIQRIDLAISDNVLTIGGTSSQEDRLKERFEDDHLKSIFTDDGLTDSQSEAVDALDEFLKDPNAKCFVLNGYAGTGKTYLIGGLAKYLHKHKVLTDLMAPTGRAASVLSTQHKIFASTIHRKVYAIDKLKEYKEIDENGEVTFKLYFELKNNDDEHDTVFIVDEASMLSDMYFESEFIHFGSGRLLRDLLDYINFDGNDYNKKVIFIGDNAQLPPVGMNRSPALDEEYLAQECRINAESFELTDVVRQKDDSLILKNATVIRNCLSKQDFSAMELSTDEAEFMKVERKDFLNTYYTFINGKIDGSTIIIGYSNRQVNGYNNAIRNKLSWDNEVLIPGDRVLVVRNNYRYEIALYNGQMGQVKDVAESAETRSIPINAGLDDHGERKSKVITLTFRRAVIEFSDIEGFMHDIDCMFVEDLLQSRNRELASDEVKALYVDFKIRNKNLKPSTPEFKEVLLTDPYFNALQLKYGYAVTCHKAQGGEWPNVFVDFSHQDKMNTGALRWSYTAITRATEKVVATNIIEQSRLKPIKQRDNKNDVTDIHKVEEDQKDDHELPDFLDGHGVHAETIYKLIKQYLGDRIEINEVKTGNYLVQFDITQGKKVGLLKVHYNGKDVVTNCRLELRSDGEWADDFSDDLKNLKGKYILMPDDDITVESLPIDDPKRLFLDDLNKQLEGTNMDISNIVLYTEYHMKISYVLDNELATVNYYFNKQHQLTRYQPDVDSSGKVLAIIRGIHE